MSSAKTYAWQCDVPGCRGAHKAKRPRTMAGDWALCRKHWATVPRNLKAIIRRANKRINREVEIANGLADPDSHEPLWRAVRSTQRLERRAVRIARERALGI